MASFGKRIDNPAGRRWLKRKRVGIPAAASVGPLADWSAAALIQDISMTGAKLLGRDLPGPKSRIRLQVRDKILLGEIIWAVGDYRGLRLNFARR